ncbi:MAG: adenosylcobinamide amidohydrolase [Veillonellaceae bacterium]|nr:adenosylcobinamide amidohydrolase [Veillonellaceae bacterium]
MILFSWPEGDRLYRYEKTIVLVFGGKRRVLSTSVLNGGVREDLQAVFNHDANPGAGMACTLSAPTYEEHLINLAQDLGLEPERVSGLSTAASMENVAIVTESYRDVTVTAIVTGGVEINGGRVGDPADWYPEQGKGEQKREGTINTFVTISVNLPPGTMARALVTATEAKTAALQELLANSNYSAGIATGSGTDGTVIISDSASPLVFTNAGKHGKLGELIGRTVLQATKEALAKQSGFTPESTHHLLHRVRRYGIRAGTLYTWYAEAGGKLPRYEFMAVLDSYETSAIWVVATGLVVHLLDQHHWRLISAEELVTGTERIAKAYGFVTAEAVTPENVLKTWCMALLRSTAELAMENVGEEKK